VYKIYCGFVSSAVLQMTAKVYVIIWRCDRKG